MFLLLQGNKVHGRFKYENDAFKKMDQIIEDYIKQNPAASIKDLKNEYKKYNVVKE